MRINKLLSRLGIFSRRSADTAIDEGRVYVGEKKAHAGLEIKPGETIYVDGQPVGGIEDLEKIPPLVIALHKPRGIVCTASHKDRAPNVVDFVGLPQRVYPVGRLDKDSEGLILLTNQGDLVNPMMKAQSFHEKEYHVTIAGEVTGDFLQKMGAGVYLKELNKTTRPCTVWKSSKHSFGIVLTQGLNRQIRRMCETLGERVLALKRVRIMNLKLSGLKPGAFRRLSQEEINQLYRMLGIYESKRQNQGIS